jgi:hypothetical protein
VDDWKQLLGDHLIVLEDHKEVSTVIPEIIADVVHADATPGGSAVTSTPGTPDISSVSKTEIIL